MENFKMRDRRTYADSLNEDGCGFSSASQHILCVSSCRKSGAQIGGKTFSLAQQNEFSYKFYVNSTWQVSPFSFIFFFCTRCLVLRWYIGVVACMCEHRSAHISWVGQRGGWATWAPICTADCVTSWMGWGVNIRAEILAPRLLVICGLHLINKLIFQSANRQDAETQSTHKYDDCNLMVACAKRNRNESN